MIIIIIKIPENRTTTVTDGQYIFFSFHLFIHSEKKIPAGFCFCCLFYNTWFFLVSCGFSTKQSNSNVAMGIIIIIILWSHNHTHTHTYNSQQFDVRKKKEKKSFENNCGNAWLLGIYTQDGQGTLWSHCICVCVCMFVSYGAIISKESFSIYFSSSGFFSCLMNILCMCVCMNRIIERRLKRDRVFFWLIFTCTCIMTMMMMAIV